MLNIDYSVLFIYKDQKMLRVLSKNLIVTSLPANQRYPIFYQFERNAF